jgi:iron complex outermembrane receptor protein
MVNLGVIRMRVSLPSRLMMILVFTFSFIFAQESISGTVLDKDTGDPLVGANISIKGTVLGASTDVEGKFTISNLESGSYDLTISYVGYKTETFADVSTGSDESYELAEEIFGQQVVVSASRKSESILESPVTIEKMDAIEIKNAPKASFYEAIGNMRGVDLTTSSMAMPVLNMRGFNSTSPDRFVQFVDGMDNQAPALNFPVGNMVGMSELDIEDVEVVYGAASSLYGPNAFNGVISMKSKSPWEYQGLSVRVKSGSRNLLDGALRYASQIGDNFAYKVNFSYMQADDWVADGVANNYGTFSTSISEGVLLAGGQQSTQASIDQLTAIGADANTHPNHADYLTAVGTLQLMNGLNAFLTANGHSLTDASYNGDITYAEKDIVDYDTKNLKINTSLHYRLSNVSELSYTFNYGDGTGVYQGSNRYSLKNLSMQQHKLQMDWKDATFKVYHIVDDAGDSYDTRLASINLVKEKVPEYFGNYFAGFFGTIVDQTNNLSQPLSAAQLAAARGAGLANGLAATTWYEVGTAEFKDAFNRITKDTDPQTGSAFFDESSITHFEAVNNFDFGDDMNLIAGGSYRIYDPESQGTIFDDAKGRPDISVSEYGFFGQLEKKFGAIKLTGAMRYDKHENFDSQLSPRFSVVYNVRSDETMNGNFRFSYQTAFRNPSLQDQYILLDVGPYTLQGNVKGRTFTNGVQLLTPDFLPQGGPILTDYTVKAVQPEKVNTWEIGFKGIFWENVFFDANYYQSSYSDFIAAQNVVDFTDGKVWQIDTNVEDADVEAEGFTMTGNINLNENFSYNANLSYARLTDAPEPNDFNTPKLKWNMGFSGRKLGGFGFNVNLKHVDDFYWLGSGFQGEVPYYKLLDVALLYDFNWDGQVVNTKLAVSNLLNNEHIEAYGSPEVGRMMIFQLGTTF